MAGFKFTLPNGQPFEIKGPPGLDFAQAKAIFDKQAAAGSLVGFKPGDVLSASTQAQAGLQSAQAAVSQALSGATGALGAGIPGATGILGSVSKSLAGVGGALSGSLSAGITGLTGAIGPAVSNLKGTLSGAAGSISALATTAIGTLNKAISGAPGGVTINTADFTKQIPALGSIGNLSAPDVTGVMAQAKSLVGQATDKLSNFKGAGSFGFNAAQLEKAGIFKPGTTILAEAKGASLNDLFKSAASFTGKLGIKSGADLLASAPAQAKIQQDLMVKGLAGLATLGVPTGILSAPALGAVALLAAKSVSNAASWLKGTPAAAGVPTSAATAAAAVAPGVTNADAASTAAYAVRYAEQKVPEVFKAQVTPTPAENTTNRETLTAATTRVLGNDKIPAPNYAGYPPVLGGATQRAELLAALEAAKNDIERTVNLFNAEDEKLKVLENRQVISQQQYDDMRFGLKAVIDVAVKSFAETYDPAIARYDAAVSAGGGGKTASRIIEETGDVRAGVDVVKIESEFFRIVLSLRAATGRRQKQAAALVERVKALKTRISTNVS
jgi:hypothetical protein